MKVARQAGKGKIFSCGLPLMPCVLIQTAAGATGNESVLIGRESGAH